MARQGLHVIWHRHYCEPGGKRRFYRVERVTGGMVEVVYTSPIKRGCLDWIDQNGYYQGTTYRVARITEEVVRTFKGKKKI